VRRRRRSEPAFVVATPCVSGQPVRVGHRRLDGQDLARFSIVSGGVGAPPKEMLFRLERSYCFTFSWWTTRWSIVGIAPQSVTRSSWMSLHHRLGVELPCREDDLRARRHERADAGVEAGHVEERRREEPAGGAPSPPTSGFALPSMTFASLANMMPMTCAMVPRWVVMHGLRRPVVPDV
jgi:hypothetical protein